MTHRISEEITIETKAEMCIKWIAMIATIVLYLFILISEEDT